MLSRRAVLLFAVLCLTAGDALARKNDLFDVLSRELTETKPTTQPFAEHTDYTVCFVPGQDCEGAAVDEINRAEHTILMQAYSFTSGRIAKALVDAKRRGVDVRAILDKSQRTQKYSGA